MMSTHFQFVLFTLLCISKNGALGQIIEYNTSTASEILLECGSLDTDPYCEVDTSACASWGCGGTDIAFCDQNIFAPKSPSDYYTLTDCPDGNIARCDAACTCKTGTVGDDGTSFVPDGGDCEVLDTSPGTLAPYPTQEPSEVPTMAPTIDLTTAIIYNGTGLDAELFLFFSCDSSTVTCDEVGGRFTTGWSVYEGNDTFSEGWAGCTKMPGEDGPDCLLVCSPDCICSLQLQDADYNLTDTGDDCPVASGLPITPAPTVSPAPTSPSPSPAPTEPNSAGTSASSITALAQVAAVIASFIVV